VKAQSTSTTEGTTACCARYCRNTESSYHRATTSSASAATARAKVCTYTILIPAKALYQRAGGRLLSSMKSSLKRACQWLYSARSVIKPFITIECKELL